MAAKKTKRSVIKQASHAGHRQPANDSTEINGTARRRLFIIAVAKRKVTE
jgi:hypothetical protein